VAVSYRIVIALAAIVLLGVLFGALNSIAIDDGPVGNQSEESIDSKEGSQVQNTVSTIWGLAPVFGLLAIVAWLLRQSLFVRQ